MSCIVKSYRTEMILLLFFYIKSSVLQYVSMHHSVSIAVKYGNIDFNLVVTVLPLKVRRYSVTIIERNFQILRRK